VLHCIDNIVYYKLLLDSRHISDAIPINGICSSQLQDDREVGFVLEQHAKLDFYSASSRKHAGRHVARTHYDSEPTSVCSFSLDNIVYYKLLLDSRHISDAIPINGICSSQLQKKNVFLQFMID
jgi:hypothetical protein